MKLSTRSRQVSGAFVKLADTLDGKYDLADLLHTLVEQSVELLDATAAGLTLADPHGILHVLASTSYESHRIEALQLKHGAGPCVDCYRTGTPIAIRDIAGTEHRWPEFSDAATSQGFRSAYAFPMRLPGRTIGAMNLFRTDAGKLPDDDIAIGQALTDVATINLLQKRTARQSAITNEQLQEALDSRILIEQAKGMIAHGQNIDTNTAFQRLRTYSRAHSQNLHETAEAVLDRTLTV